MANEHIAMTESPQIFAGPFEVSESGSAVVLTRAGGDLKLVCNVAGAHDLPARLDGLTLQRAIAPDRAFRLSTSQGQHVLNALSVQVHERVSLYGTVIALPRFALGERLKWSLLLWVARFHWGQALIRRLTQRKSL